MNSTRAAASANGGSSTVSISNNSDNFEVGQLVLLHQTQGGALPGHYEFGRVAGVIGATVTLEKPLASSYSSAGSQRAQIVGVPELSNLTIESGGSMTAPAWDGASGGILVMDVAGAVSVKGTITMTGKGYRGAPQRTCTMIGAARHCFDGMQGEGHLGPGASSHLANGSGGGGGVAGSSGHCGSGGSYGSRGGDGTQTFCSIVSCCASSASAVAGSTAGSEDLALGVLFGGAGGEGGANENGSYPGAGGNGGGIIFLRSGSIDVTGSLATDGARGGDGDAYKCGTGCGMGGGGGGAGGAVRLELQNASAIGTQLVHAVGGGPGINACGNFGTGRGGFGRIGIKVQGAATVVGTANPPADPR